MENVVEMENRRNSGENEAATTAVEGGNVARSSTGLSAVTINSGIVSTTAGGLQVVDNVTTTNSEVGLGRTEIVASLGQEKENIAGGGLENPVNNIKKSRLKVTIKSWNGVAVWKWLAKDDDCGICRFPFHGCCTDCKFAGDDCPLVWGECTHCFHLHCIMKWLQTNQQCPMCRKEWKYLNS